MPWSRAAARWRAGAGTVAESVRLTGITSKTRWPPGTAGTVPAGAPQTAEEGEEGAQFGQEPAADRSGRRRPRQAGPEAPSCECGGSSTRQQLRVQLGLYRVAQYPMRRPFTQHPHDIREGAAVGEPSLPSAPITSLRRASLAGSDGPTSWASDPRITTKPCCALLTSRPRVFGVIRAAASSVARWSDAPARGLSATPTLRAVRLVSRRRRIRPATCPRRCAATGARGRGRCPAGRWALQHRTEPVVGQGAMWLSH